MKKVAIVMGSDSDLPILEKTMNTLKEFGVPYETHVYSAHRTPDEAIEFAKNAKANGFGVIIGAAGMAAHLAGVIAGNTILPVIGIPCKSTCLDGMDALLATVMMPSGIPVATVAINGGVNAGLLAIEMLAIGDEELSNKLLAKRLADKQKVLEKNKAVEEKYNG
jgi:5-(carboxyamino)imidazole ribonucleotide mutase